ncbi:MAG: hypothetical protein ACJZ4A_03215 [Candidatus Pelagibacter sp.]|tara:strand:- start:1237 stop:2541 length:1305 start_codon:yes stop_codon:yes gene_type:complete
MNKLKFLKILLVLIIFISFGRAFASEKNITYIQILQKPNDLELNIKYAQQQGKIGNFKQTISTLERLNMVYPDNIEIKMYLLSVLVQADSPDKALTVIDEIKNNEDATEEDLLTVKDIEKELEDRARPKLWSFAAGVNWGLSQSNNVNNVSKTRLQMSSGSLDPFNSPMHDRTYSASTDISAVRRIGEDSSFLLNASVSDSRQVIETGDDVEGYTLTTSYDTTIGNQGISIFGMFSKSDYIDDADSFSTIAGLSGFFPSGDRSTYSYSYSLSDSKGNRNSSDTTADETNSIGHSVTIGHDYAVNEIISTSLSTGYGISENKVGVNDYETFDFGFRLNLNLPIAYVSIGEALSFNEYFEFDSSNNSALIRSDVANTFDVIVVKPLGDFLPFLDPNKLINLSFSYDKTISEANIINYDYEAESFGFGISRSFDLRG